MLARAKLAPSWVSAVFALVALSSLSPPACQTYVSPPVPSLDGLHDGLLDDPAQPIVIRFTHAVEPSTLRVLIVKFEPDANGLLADEHGDPAVDLQPFFTHEPSTDPVDTGGTGAFDADALSFQITLPARLPVGPKLAVLIEAGLKSTTGETTAVRKRLLFTYGVKCVGNVASTFASGVYFFLLNVEQPIGTQIKLWSQIVVDPKTGIFQGQFTRAGRLPDPNRCNPPCTGGNVCQTVPSTMCVLPSTRAGTTDEFVDFFADPTPPVGYTLTATGCVIDQPGGLVAFTTAPANLVVEQPAVTVSGLVIIASFAPDAAGVMRATGGITGDEILLGKVPLGAGHGTVAARFVPADQAPSVPAPPPKGTP